MGKNAYERRIAREAKTASPPMHRSIKWHERNVIASAKRVSEAHKRAVVVNTVVAVELLTEAVERYEAALYESKVKQRHELS